MPNSIIATGSWPGSLAASGIPVAVARWVLSGTDAACFGLVNEYLAHLADRNCSPREVLDLLAFCRWLRDQDVELARVTTAVLLRFLAVAVRPRIAGSHGMPAVTASTRRSLDPHRQGIQ